MKRKLASCAYLITVAVMLTALGGCSKPNRGTFTADACPAGDRVDAPAPPNAVLAVYFDASGAVIGNKAEVMAGTADNRMCPAEEAPGGPVDCPAGTCPFSIPQLGKTYCRPC